MVDRDLLSLLQASARLPSSAQPFSEGIELQGYCAIIACMLISLWTGKKPTLRTHEMICWYFCGMASEEELLAHLAKLHKPTEPRKRLI